MINARIKLENKSNKIINIFKAKHDLKDKSEAINKFINLHGKKEIKESEVREDYIEKLKELEKEYFKKNKKIKSMTNKEFKELFK